MYLLSAQWEPKACTSWQCCQKKGSSKVWGGIALSGLLGSGRAGILPLGTLGLGLWVIAVDPALIECHQSIKNCGIWIDQLDHLPAVMTTSFFLVFSDHPWDKICANLPHLQFLRIIVYTIPTLTSNCALIVSIETRWSEIFWPSTRPKNAIPRWCTGRKWHIPMASNRKRSCMRINMCQGEGPTVPLQSDALEESDLWTAWQLFPLDDD